MVRINNDLDSNHFGSRRVLSLRMRSNENVLHLYICSWRLLITTPLKNVLLWLCDFLNVCFYCYVRSAVFAD